MVNKYQVPTNPELVCDVVDIATSLVTRVSEQVYGRHKKVTEEN